MSPSSLPTELLRQIIASTVPSTYHSTTYKERQRTLCALCLVSYRFRQIAQPLLYEIVRLEVFDEEFSARMANLASDQCKRTRHAVIATGAVSTNALVEAFPNVASFALNEFPEATDDNVVDLSALVRLRRLRNLQVATTSFRFDEQFQLPNLVSLTLSSQQGFRGILDMLSPTILPSLRALGLKEHRKAVIPMLCSAPTGFQLLEQLDALVVYLEALSEEAIMILRPLMTRILVQTWIESDRYRFFSDRVQHLRLSTATHHLAVQIGEQTNSDLRSVYLDSSTSNSYGKPETIELLAYCQQRKIEVIREARPINSRGDTFISPEFWRRQRERRRLEGDQAK